MTPEEILEQQQRHAGAAAAEATGNPMYTSAADFDAQFTRMLADEEKQEREKQEKKVQRQQAAQAISDTYGVLFNDVIKASQGATVSPRDVQQRYDRLDDKSKQLYDAYRARMDLIRKQAQGNAKGYYDLAQRAKDKGDAEALRRELAGLQEEGRNARAAAANAARIRSAQLRANAQIKSRSTGSGEQEIVIPFAGQDYPVQKKVYDGRMAQLYAYLDQNNLFPEESQASDELKSIMYLMGSNNSSKAPESSKAKLATAVYVALNYINADSEHAANIMSILKGTYGSPEQNAAAQQPKQKKTIPGVNGN